MYNDSTPIDGQTSSTRGNLTNSSKSNPCPVCGRTKDGDCRISGDGKMVLCHQNFDNAKTQQPELWHFDKSSSDGRCGIYIFKEESESIQSIAKKPRAKKKEVLPVPIPIDAKLLRLPAPEQSPQPEPLAKDAPKRIRRDAVQITYEYSPTQGVVRYQWQDETNPKGRDKTFSQFHIDPDGKKVWTKGDAPWPAYRIDEVVEILKTVPDSEPVVIPMLEGENNVEIARSIRLAALTLQGSNWGDREIQKMLEALQATGKNVSIAIIQDNDDTGIKKGKAVWLVARHLQFPCLIIDPAAIDVDIPEKGDIREFLEIMEADEFLIRVEAEIFKASNLLTSDIPINSHPRTCEGVVSLSSIGSVDNYIPDTAPAGEQSYVHKAIEALYSDGHWASVAGQLLKFTGTYYEVRPEGSEKRRIYAWLKTYVELVNGKYRCNRYNSASANEVYNCIAGSVDVDIKDVNPPGLNCSNGVLRINPDGSHTLHPHNSDQIYTYVGGKYDPDIDPRDCDRLLECLEPAQREIFIRTVAASLCLPLVRLKMSRVKGLLCHGDGSNGKDALRTALVAVLGRGVTGKTLKDFQMYDTGRKFPLAGLEGSLCNWSSENSDSAKLDKLQSLKQFITGDELTIEHKGKGEYPYKPEAIFLANCNLLPSISSDAEAIKSRYCIVSFKKTYAVGADASKGQLEADPRFKEDPSFVVEKIAPALLNRMLECLPSILKEGIDYNSTNAALRAAQEKSNHLWQFMRDRGYEAGKGERVYAKDVWNDLVDWYVETGTLEIDCDRDGKEKRIWNELPGRDTPVKAINQVFARFSELVPNLEKYRHTERGFESERTRGDFYYIGLTKQDSEKSGESAPPSPPVDTARKSSPPVLHQETHGGALVEQTILTQSGGGDGGALCSPFAEMCNLLSQLSESERQKLADLLAQPQLLPAQITSEDARELQNADEHQAKILADQMREAIAKSSYEDARKVVGQVARSNSQVRRFFAKSFNEEESLNIRLLKHYGLTRGTRVKYVGDAKYAEQYKGLGLEVYNMDKYFQIACLKPDGTLTTWLKPEEWEKL
jgi:putative DNA primase/helicase